MGSRRQLTGGGVDCAHAGDDVQAGEEDEAEGPEAHAEVVHARVVEAAQEERHAAELEQDGDDAGHGERVANLGGLRGWAQRGDMSMS